MRTRARFLRTPYNKTVAEITVLNTQSESIWL